MASTAIVSMEVKEVYCSTTSIISRPLYFPQCGHTRCGNFGSWQFGHCDKPGFFSESCARRVEVRCLECRRFGFGIYSKIQDPLEPSSGSGLLAPGSFFQFKCFSAAQRSSARAPRHAHCF